MAGFMKTINLWDANIQRMIANGELVLRTGQWVQCGEGTKSRFVSYNPQANTFNVAHGETIEEVNKRFAERIHFMRMADQRSQALAA